MAIENLKVKSIALTKEFFKDGTPLMKVSDSTRLQLLYQMTRSTVLPIVKSVELKLLTTSPTYQELKTLKLFQCSDDGVTTGLSTVVITKQTLENLGIRLHFEQASSSESAVYKPSKIEQEMYGEAVFILHCYNDTREWYYKKKGETFVHARLVYAGTVQRDCVKIALYCRDHKIEDQKLYVFTLFKHYGWSFCPPLKMLHGQETFTIFDNEKDTARSDLLSWEAAEKRVVEEKRAKESGAKKSPYRDMFSGVEKTKSALIHQGKEEACMSQINSLFGYHPKSPVCDKCKISSQCREALKNVIQQHTNGLMDVIALRNGTQDLIEVAEKLMAAGVTIDLYGDGGIE